MIARIQNTTLRRIAIVLFFTVVVPIVLPLAVLLEVARSTAYALVEEVRDSTAYCWREVKKIMKQACELWERQA